MHSQRQSHVKRMPVLRSIEPHRPSSLSRRQRQVLDGLKDGMSEKQIAAGLGISRHTVHVYVKAIYRHFDVSSRAELLSLWISPTRLPHLRQPPRRLLNNGPTVRLGKSAG